MSQSSTGEVGLEVKIEISEFQQEGEQEQCGGQVPQEPGNGASVQAGTTTAQLEQAESLTVMGAKQMVN